MKLDLIFAAAGIAAAALVASLAAASVANAAETSKKPTSQCFYSRDVNSWSAPDDNTVYIKVGVNDVYKLDVLGPCSGLSFAGNAIGLQSRGGGPGNSFICSALDVEIVVPDRVPNRCDVSTITRLTPADVAALPVKSRP